MLPTISVTRPRLADVMESAFAAVTGAAGAVPFAVGRSVVVVVVDGLGAENLVARSGHARTLSRAVTAQSESAGAVAPRAVSGFPSTTVAQLTSLTTGVLPGTHGLVGYSLADPASGKVANLVSGWSPTMTPEAWQPVPTIFERLRDVGVPGVVVGPPEYKGTPFSRAFLWGAEYLGVASIADRLETAMRRAAASLCVVYAYIADVDAAGHRFGWQSPQWSDALEEVDAGLATALRLRGGASVCVTADHGMVDTTEHIYLDEFSSFAGSVRAVAGEPRCPQLYLHDAVNAGPFAAAINEWMSVDADVAPAVAVTRADAIGAGWFGDVTPAAESRIGDVLIPALDTVTALYDRTSAKPSSLAMIGQHGSITDTELFVPLILFDAG